MHRFAIVLTLAVVLSAFSGVCQAATVLVTPADMQGWVEANAEGSVIGESKEYPALGEFRAGSPAGNPLGPGAYFMKPGGGLDFPGQVWLGTDAHNGVFLSQITRLTYTHFTYIRGDNPPDQRVAQPPNLQFMVTRDGINYRYLIHMPWGTPTWENGELRNSGVGPLSDYEVWKTVDCMTEGVWWDPYGGDWGGTWAQLLQRYPNARLQTPTAVGNVWGAAQTLTGGSLNFEWGGRKVSDRVTGPWWKEGYNGEAYLDNFTIGVNGAETTYNFEDAAKPAVIINNKAAGDPIMGEAKKHFLFTVFGRVDFTDFTSDTLTVDDGSGKPILVKAVNHGVNPFEYIKATGTLDSATTPPSLSTTAEQIEKLESF